MTGNKDLQSIIVPIIVAIVTGVASSYTTTRVTLSVVETKVGYIENDVLTIKDLLAPIRKNQIELAWRGEWIKNTKDQLKTIERVLDAQDASIDLIADKIQDRYTKSEADKDMKILAVEIEELRKIIEASEE